jgi:hypothetical protein
VRRAATHTEGYLAGTRLARRRPECDVERVVGPGHHQIQRRGQQAAPGQLESGWARSTSIASIERSSPPLITSSSSPYRAWPVARPAGPRWSDPPTQSGTRAGKAVHITFSGGARRPSKPPGCRSRRPLPAPEVCGAPGCPSPRGHPRRLLCPAFLRLYEGQPKIKRDYCIPLEWRSESNALVVNANFTWHAVCADRVSMLAAFPLPPEILRGRCRRKTWRSCGGFTKRG